MARRRVVVSWSTGKDSAWTLHVLRQQAEVEVVGLVTTVTEAFGRVAMHGTRREIAQAQAAAVRLPLEEVVLPWPCTNADYEQRMHQWLVKARARGVTSVAFGDLFLPDVRQYRERLLASVGLEALFPLWTDPGGTGSLARRMLDAGMRAIIVCVDSKQLPQPERWLGRVYDAGLLAELPGTVDPCGERGEFHTVCVAGPMLWQALRVVAGERVVRDHFHYVDMVLEK